MKKDVVVINRQENTGIYQNTEMVDLIQHLGVELIWKHGSTIRYCVGAVDGGRYQVFAMDRGITRDFDPFTTFTELIEMLNTKLERNVNVSHNYSWQAYKLYWFDTFQELVLWTAKINTEE